MDSYLAEFLPRLEAQSQRHQCSVNELLNYWLTVDENYEIDTLVMLAKAVNELPVGLTVIDPNQPENPIVYTNQEWKRATGFNPKELFDSASIVGQKVSTQPAINALRHAITQRQPCTTILHNNRNNDTLIENEIHFKPLTDDQGRVTHFVAIQHDVTAYETARHDSEKHNAELSSLFNDPSNAVLIANNEGVYVECNAVACNLLGQERDSLIGNTIANFVVPAEEMPVENVWTLFF
jgi:PAS domain S-box-containing protein